MFGLNATVSVAEGGVGDATRARWPRCDLAAYLVDERVRDMDRNGVLASMCFPSLPGFSGRRFQEAKDKDLALVMLQAYNDWHIDEWCGSHPGRFIPLSIGPIWDMDAMVAELKRVAAKGCRAISMPELPHMQGLPSYANDYWDPFFQAVCDLRHGRVPAHRHGSRRHQHGPRLLDGQLHGAVDAGHGAGGAGPALGPGNAASSPSSRSRSPRAGSGGSRS